MKPEFSALATRGFLRGSQPDGGPVPAATGWCAYHHTSATMALGHVLFVFMKV